MNLQLLKRCEQIPCGGWILHFFRDLPTCAWIIGCNWFLLINPIWTDVGISFGDFTRTAQGRGSNCAGWTWWRFFNNLRCLTWFGDPRCTVQILLLALWWFIIMNAIWLLMVIWIIDLFLIVLNLNIIMTNLSHRTFSSTHAETLYLNLLLTHALSYHRWRSTHFRDVKQSLDLTEVFVLIQVKEELFIQTFLFHPIFNVLDFFHLLWFHTFLRFSWFMGFVTKFPAWFCWVFGVMGDLCCMCDLWSMTEERWVIHVT